MVSGIPARTVPPDTDHKRSTMPTVTVPAEFFRGELRVYGDWREALARELLQNASDADPSRIEITLDDVADHGRLTFIDDGHGMSRDVLENVFFALGRTTKTGPDTIGGFGRARVIICFAQAHYQIRTGTLVAEGTGGQYTIREGAEYQPGTQVIVDLIDADAGPVRDAFRRVLADCDLPVPVTLDGRAVRGRPAPGRATRVLRDERGTTWGRLYVEPARTGQLLVRVRGLTMFRRWLPGDDDVVLELVAERSREVLTAGRDRVRGTYAGQLDRFLAQLSGNRKAALRPPVAPLDRRVAGGGFLFTHPPAPADPAAGTADRSADPAPAAAGEGRTPAPARPGELDLGIPEPAPTGLGFDVYLMADRDDARTRRLVRTWDPTGWGERDARRHRLLLSWRRAVAAGLDLLLPCRPDLGTVAWTVGWTFDPDERAVHRAVGDGHVIALNPVTADRTARFRLSRRADRRELLAIALHEVCHVVAADHDERFAALLTELVGRCDQTAVDRSLRALRARPHPA